MSLPVAATEALEAFTALQGWEQRARLLMQWGERLEPLSEVELGDEQRVQGCESNVWLVADQRDQRWHFRAYSDARLLRGLLALLLVRVEGMPEAELAAIDLTDWFNQLGLGRQLSPSRSNGLNAVLKRMQDLISA
ncbi:SufE family protein [Pseudomonas nicosulfuronedens]|uniref:SufE family protein n=1 Tax=Pseudomonas nicosulfuronedens TaxID=2571105 RepID=A0A5R9RNJ3_9PSED|nr:SufE family protein [Pseudomonas nicosulfuronedens]MDH1007209.1 SufE family protein [Pseudomonas nicosulfuronedens]MDH1982054.1 SufE family protein [Pseudomonas nicosulfuronedens]MDH2026304.1 SufE family protein [Pseudomonas nicosulfuronedens]TLX78032.1 SufE family protein [Pseudomonas nicosulfuronedens]